MFQGSICQLNGILHDAAYKGTKDLFYLVATPLKRKRRIASLHFMTDNMK
jgi:hypothetical protein